MFGYGWGQLRRALTTAGDSPDPAVQARAEKRANSWVRVLAGLATGQIRVGSRMPVKDFPIWLTPEIVRGGFATGAAAAGGALQDDEVALAHRVDIPADRARIFAWFLSDDGLAQLHHWLDSGRYRVQLPEHAALLTIAQLLRSDQPDTADDLLRTIEPWAGRIRFWPFEATEPEAPGVHVATLPKVAQRLAAKRPQRQVEAEREALTIWAPFTDRVVAHWWQTRTDVDAWTAGVDSSFPPGWQDGARALLAEYSRLAAEHQLTTKHADPKGNLQLMLTGLRRRLAEPNLPAQGKVRHAVSCIVAKRGAAGSPELLALRQGQATRAAQPSHALLAHQVAGTLNTLGVTGAAPDPLALVDDSELLPSIRRVLRQATQAPLAELLAAGIVRSAESLAELAPQLTAETVATRYADPVAGTLAKRTYRSFANRRGVLLLHHESQVGIESIPWFTALERTAATDAPNLAHAQAADLATLALRHFAGTVPPNSLIRELARLYTLASEDVPLTYELAADIFMGTFSEVFQRAAQEAAQVVGGTLYARYYNIDYPAIQAFGTSSEPGWFGGPPRTTVPQFDALVQVRSGWRSGLGYSPASNGTAIEQAQILTTHNLAVLVKQGATIDPPALAQSAWAATLAHLSKAANGHRLRHRKNAAFAWRQTLFFLSQASPAEVAGFLDRNRTLGGLHPEVTTRAAELLEGLAEVADGRPLSSEPFLGWVMRSAG